MTLLPNGVYILDEKPPTPFTGKGAEVFHAELLRWWQSMTIAQIELGVMQQGASAEMQAYCSQRDSFLEGCRSRIAEIIAAARRAETSPDGAP